MAKYWIKLWHKALDNRELAQLPDHLWRRFHEMCLFAGKMEYPDDHPDNGRLPSAGEMAWTLRVSEEALTADLEELARRGFIEYRSPNVLNGYWFVTKFNEHQRKMTKAEYMRRKRSVTAELPPRYQSVTIGNIDIDKEREREEEEDRETDRRSRPSWQLPPALNSDAFTQAWYSWYLHRFDKQKPLTQLQGDKILEELASMGEERATIAINYSIKKGWLNIYEPGRVDDTAVSETSDVFAKARQKYGVN